MRWLREVSLLLVTLIAVDSVIRSAYFRLYKNKRLTTTVTKTLTTHSPLLCVNHCLAMEGCLAVNFVSSSRTICELTSGVTNMSNLVDDHSSDLYVVDKCRYQGDRCEKCADKRFTGDECDTCAPGYYGNACDYVFVELLKHNCLTGNDLQIIPGSNAEEIEVCKELCAGDPQYGGFAVYYGNCYFKSSHCKNDLRSDSKIDTYLKETVEV